MSVLGYLQTSRPVALEVRLSPKTEYQNQHVRFSENCECLPPESSRLKSDLATAASNPKRTFAICRTVEKMAGRPLHPLTMSHMRTKLEVVRCASVIFADSVSFAVSFERC